MPSLVHAQTAHRIYDQDFTIESRYDVLPDDRLINHAAECRLQYYLFMDGLGVTIAGDAVRESDREGRSTNYTRTRRRSAMTQGILEGTGLAMTAEQMRHARGIRAAYRAGLVDLNRLEDLVANRC